MRKKVAVVSIIICLLIIMIPDRVKETPQVDKQATNVQATDINTTATVKEEEKNQDEKLTLSINDLIKNEKVMQTTDNEFYMNHNNKKEKFIGGSLFVDYRIDLNNTRKIIIYGHSSSTVDIPFTKLLEYKKQSFLISHPNIELTYKDKKEIYQIFTIMLLKEDYFYTRLALDDEKFIKHLEELKKKSIYDTGINIENTNKILILQTCSQDEDGQYLVIGAKLKEKI